MSEDQEQDESGCGAAAGVDHDALAAAAAAAFKFDDVMGGLSSPVQAAMKAMSGPNGALSAAVLGPHQNGVGGLSATMQTAIKAMSGPHISGLSDLIGRYPGLDAATRHIDFKLAGLESISERYLHGLTGLVGAGGVMADHLSIFNKMMGESQRAMHEAMRGPAESIIATMRGWSTLADGGLWAARLALRMALGAKRAVMRGDIDAVKQFLCDWLEFTFEKVTDDLVNSASLVLLDEQAWLPDDVLALDYDPCKKLRKLTLAEHRSCTRLIIDPRKRAHYKSVISLDKSIAAAGSDSPATLLDLVAAKPLPEPTDDDDDDINDPRVLRVLAKLTHRERKIAAERGHPGMTWAGAAVGLGGTADEGFKLGRKINRLSKISGASAGAACRRPDPVRGSVSARAAGR